MPATRPPEPPGIDAFFAELFSRAGLAQSAYRRSALVRRVPSCLRFLRVKDLRAARRALTARPEVVPDLLSVVLLGVTEFCRDQPVFDTLRELILPGWQSFQRPLRIWSAACSDGRELYSVALALLDAGLADQADLLGTDCRLDAIRHAAKGVFLSDSTAGLAPSWQSRFVVDGRTTRIDPAISDGIRWKQADLLEGVEPGPWDMILWRNMAIYLEPAVAENIWRALIDQLAPGGYLICGKADHPPPHARLDKLRSCIFRKRFANP